VLTTRSLCGRQLLRRRRRSASGICVLPASASFTERAARCSDSGRPHDGHGRVAREWWPDRAAPRSHRERMHSGTGDVEHPQATVDVTGDPAAIAAQFDASRIWERSCGVGEPDGTAAVRFDRLCLRAAAPAGESVALVRMVRHESVRELADQVVGIVVVVGPSDVEPSAPVAPAGDGLAR
jgi:hypothetical protein